MNQPPYPPHQQQQPHGQQNPYQAPHHGAPQPALQMTAAQLYGDVAIYRRSGPISALLLFSLVTAFVGPFVLTPVLVLGGALGAALVGTITGAPLLIVCVICLSGPIYYDALVAPGQLKVWSVANKVVAAVLLAGWVFSVARVFL